VQQGIPIQFIMKLSGYKAEREFLKYLKQIEEDIAKKLSETNYFVGIIFKLAE
jgi:hypothetical protein